MKNTHDEMIEVIQAHKEGKDIQFDTIPLTYDKPVRLWCTIDLNHSFDFSKYVYRVKPPEIEAWGLVTGGELLDSYKYKSAATYYGERTSNATLIRLIPDPNYKG